MTLFLIERAADRAFGAKPVVVAGGEPNARLERVRRLPGHDVDRPADRVPSVERPLRPPQDFDALDVQEVGEHHRRPPQIDAVEMDGRTWVGAGDRAVRADAADRHLRCAGVLRHRDRRHNAREAFDRCTPICSSVLAGSTVIATGVDWTSAAPVFVAVTVNLSGCAEMASSKSSGAPESDSMPEFDGRTH